MIAIDIDQWSPQTLTVTRGVAPTTAVAHTAGATISIWNPGVFGV